MSGRRPPSQAGRSRAYPQVQYPPCVSERATFMADFAFTRVHEHPYTKHDNASHAHFKPTPLRYPAYGAAAVPFRWLMRKFVFGDPGKGIPGFVERFPLQEVDPAYEPSLGFDTNWFQDHRNHRALLECFWNHVRPEESLVFFYAKHVPLVEDTGRRVIIGVGRVKSVGGLTEYEYRGSPGNKLRSYLWERMVVHSIRPDMADGFLMPYHRALEASDDGRAFDPAEAVAFAPEDRFGEFSYVTEHVSHDAAISALLSCRDALLRSAQLFDVPTAKPEAWIDRQLGYLWKRRGPFPGIGAVLSAMRISMGHFIAQALIDGVGDEGNPWTAWDAVLKSPTEHLPRELSRHVDGTIAKAWKKMVQERRAFLELLSRIDLTVDQASLLAIPEVRAENGIDVSDSAFLENPYLIYEATRLTTTSVALGTVDRGLFPTHFIREKHPIPEPTRVDTPVDARRLRALTIRELEAAASRGDTLRPRDHIITALRGREGDKREDHTDVTADLLAVVEEERFAGEVQVVPMADGCPAYQLELFADAGKIIRTEVHKRCQGQRLAIAVDWRAELDGFLEAERVRTGRPSSDDPAEIETEERARQEKAAALAEIAAARFSVLIGPAGTGKTTLLSVLCRRPEVHDQGILLLAPTGKARVRMEAIARQAGTPNFEALTIAQFLSPSGRYDAATQRYRLTRGTREKVGRTVIVDECSMLTEEMMAALLEALSGVHRLVFVGDSRQLPPIGAGRPFVDIVAHLTPADIESRFPRVSTGFAELTVPRRQGVGERDDLQLAAWFGGGASARAKTGSSRFSPAAGRAGTSDSCSGRRPTTWSSPLRACCPRIWTSIRSWRSGSRLRSASARGSMKGDRPGSTWNGPAVQDPEGKPRRGRS